MTIGTDQKETPEVQVTISKSTRPSTRLKAKLCREHTSTAVSVWSEVKAGVADALEVSFSIDAATIRAKPLALGALVNVSRGNGKKGGGGKAEVAQRKGQ